MAHRRANTVITSVTTANNNDVLALGTNIAAILKL